MSNLNIRNLNPSLLRAINIEAAKAEQTQREWVIRVLMDAVNHGKNDEKD